MVNDDISRLSPPTSPLHCLPFGFYNAYKAYIYINFELYWRKYCIAYSGREQNILIYIQTKTRARRYNWKLHMLRTNNNNNKMAFVDKTQQQQQQEQ